MTTSGMIIILLAVVITMLTVTLFWLWIVESKLNKLDDTIRTMDEREQHDQNITEQMILENRRMICRQEDDGK